jgi:hypothetical protein
MVIFIRGSKEETILPAIFFELKDIKQEEFQRDSTFTFVSYLAVATMH